MGSDAAGGESVPPRRVSLRDRQRELTRQALLDGARAAFEEHGYPATTIDDIAARAGASRGTFYLYFTKATVMAELVNTISPTPGVYVDGRLTTELRTVDLSSNAAIRAWMHEYAHRWDHMQPLGRAYLEGDATDPELQAATDSYYAASINELIDHIRAVHGDAIGADEARARATVMHFALQGFVYNVSTRDLDADLELGLDMLTDQWLRTLNAPPEAGSV